MNLSKSLLIVSACVAGIPCGKPAYVFSVPFCTSFCTSSTARGPEVALGTTWLLSPFMAKNGHADLLQVVGVVLADERGARACG